MAQTPGGLNASTASATMQTAPLGCGREQLNRAVIAANDASNLADALGANLDWIAQSLSSAPMNDDVRQLARETVEVCRQLTKLLGGAIGSCRTVTNSASPSARPFNLAKCMEEALIKVSRMADSMGVLVLSEGPADLAAAIDRQLMTQAIDTLLLHALRGSPTQGVVRIAFARCGSHAVIGLTSDGPGLSLPQLEELYAASCACASESPEALRSISTMLFEQGGYLDSEVRPGGGLTLFIVVPASDENIEESAASGTVFAHGSTSPQQLKPVLGQKRSEKMIVQSDKFGALEVDATDVLNFPTGIIGFPREGEFVLVRRADSQVIGWLQSTQTTYLTLPVVSAHALAPRFPDVPIEVYAERAGLGSDPEELAVLAVLSAPPGQPATVNLMAPIIVNATTRTGAQILI